MRNFAFPGYAKHVWTRIAIRATPVGAGLERPPPSGDRWLRPVDPNLGAGSASGTYSGAVSGTAARIGLRSDVRGKKTSRRNRRLPTSTLPRLRSQVARTVPLGDGIVGT